MMLSIMAQVSVARAEEMPVSDLAVQQTEVSEQEAGQSEDAVSEDTEPRAATSETAAKEELAEATPSQEDELSVSLMAEEEPEEEPAAEELGDISGVEVSLLSALTLYRDVDFNVAIYRGKELVDEKTATLSANTQGSAPASQSVRFSDLASGTYTLAVSGSGFETYKQELTVQDNVASVQVYTSFLAGFTYGDDQLHPGALIIGDATDDGSVDQEDVDAIVDQIQAGKNEAGDLNGDGVVDLVDLQLLAAVYQDGRDNLSSVTTRVSEKMAQTGTAEGTSVTGGSLEEVIAGTGTVSLQNSSSEAISEANPVEVSFDFTSKQETVQMGGMVIQTPADSGNAISSAEVTVEYVDLETGETATLPLTIGGVAVARARGASAQVGADGSIVLDFGRQIAVKKVTIKVTATADNTNLAEISKVEFVNNMENHIPAPEMNIPSDLSAETGNKSFTLTWSKETNVTGYEVKIAQGGKEEVIRTSVNSLSVTTFGGAKLENGTQYTVSVQSVNGEWRSGYSESITVTPKADKIPAAPDGLTLTGRFQRIDASWLSSKDADSYNVYYRKQGDEAFASTTGVTGTSLTIRNLENNAKYEVYVTAVNELGESPASLTSVVSTANVTPVNMPSYKLINTPESAGVPSSRVVKATHSAGYMKDSPLDSGNSAWGIVDGDFTSWYALDDWDDGAMYPDEGGVRVTFDQKYHIGSISLTQIEDYGYYQNVRVFAHNAEGKEYQVPGVSITKHGDGNGRYYYTIKIAGGVETDYLRVCVGHQYNYRSITISEMRFYAYDSLEADILALYGDDLHVTLAEGVDEETINALEERLNTRDNGELHPDYNKLKTELDNARGLLLESLNDVVSIHTSITAQSDGHLGINGLNAWQPLGVTAHAGEELVIYVGSSTGTTGSNAALQLIASQYNAEYGQVVSKPIQLKIGRNEIMVPDLVSFDAEHGGALYVQYTGASNAAQYSVRVSGGVKIPTLDLYGIDDAGQRLELVTAYMEELETYTAQLEEQHNSTHKDSGIAAVNHDYNAQECILNTTDIVLDQMMLSVPASQILAGLSGDNTAARAQELLNSLDAMDQMMTLFYQHKGLTNLADAGAKNRLPAQHLNIRYMRMFAGAFMYAAGNHIGIGWDSVTGLSQGNPVVLNEDGTYASGNFFGWGIAHEIGHNINNNKYTVVEVTNNFFSQISQISEGVRFSYDDVYKKVTSGTKGHSDNVFTQLALYWQLHLAYDTSYEYEIYDNYKDLFNGRFFARVDTYARNPAAAPDNGTALTLGGDADQNLMRLACAAAEKDLTDFFQRWGMTPDQTTAAYAAQFEKETRAIYYVNDDARDYAFTHDASASIAGQSVMSGETTAAVDEKTPNQVNLTLKSTVDSGLLLGYEISRVTYENGKAQTEVVGFTTGDSYTDTITTVNNRTVTYVVTAVDKFLNRSESLTLPTVKISHDGSHDKSLWTAATNMVSEQDHTHDATESDPCEPETESAIRYVIDNSKSTTFVGKAESGQAVVTLDFHKSLAVTGFKYTVTSGTPIENYEIQITTNGSQWTTVASGTFTDDSVNVVYFRNQNNDPWVATYDATQIRLIVKTPANTEISISELDVLGPTGDNVELLANGIGYLESEYRFADGDGNVIPAGSLIFTGEYKGNPAYNVVLLYGQDGSLVGGVDSDGDLRAQQIILAPDPGNGELGEVSDGIWVYWIEPGDLEGFTLPDSVRAELYRVDNAITNEGQRLTADTLLVELPEELPTITIASDNAD